MKYGLIAGIATCAWIMLEFALGFHTTRMDVGEYTGYFSNLIPVITLFLLLREKQKETYDGRLTLAQGIAAGLLASFVMALVVYIFMFFYTWRINPNWLDNTLEWKVAQSRAQQVPEASIRQTITAYRQANTPVGMIAATVLSLTAVGGLIGLVLTFVLRLLPSAKR